MNAPILTNVNKKSGSPPSGTTDVYDKLNQRRDSGGSASYYVRGHLLNEKLGGKGTWINMTPLSRVGNKEHEQQFEAITKAAVDGGAIVEYDVKPNYFQRADKQALKDKIKATDPVNAIEKNSIVEAEDQVPLALTCFIVLKERVGNNEFKKVGTERFWSVMNPIDRSPESYFVSGESKFKPVKINSDDSTEIKRLPGISDAAVSKIIATIQRRGQAYGRFEVLKRELVDDHSIVPQEKMDQWLEKNMITLSK
jgi:DNA uptake protein ComE-like DNA-binding protein